MSSEMFRAPEPLDDKETLGLFTPTHCFMHKGLRLRESHKLQHPFKFTDCENYLSPTPPLQPANPATHLRGREAW